MNKTIQFNGTFPSNCQAEAVPPSLQTLVAMKCHGSNITEQALATQGQALLSISQLIVFNSFIDGDKGKQTTTRHNKSHEPPLPVYLGVLLHIKTQNEH